jgi:hypothetical protein
MKNRLLKNHYIFLKRLVKKHFPKLNRTELENYYLSCISSGYMKDIKYEKNKLDLYFSLREIPDDPDDPLYFQLKAELLLKIGKFQKKTFTKIKTFFIINNINFGNSMININNIMNYCDFLDCTNIYLNKNYNWYIKNTIVTEKYNISLINPSQINCNDLEVACVSIHNLFYIRPFVIFPEIKFYILRNEIKRNLPTVNIDPKDLYIHIRCGNIFKRPHPYYSQPPLCFYQKILNNFKFRKIYLIAVSNNSPIINKLLSEYPNIIFHMNSKEVDMAYLSNAYNLISSVSTFIEANIKLNDNLKILWEYDLIRSNQKILYLRYDFFYIPRKYIIYQMKPSEHYRNKMFVWRNNYQQIQLMLTEKCKYNFNIIKPNI